MPCDTIQTNTVKVDAMHGGLLGRALAAMGATFTHEQPIARFWYQGRAYTLAGGQLTSTDPNVGQVADLLKRHYSAESVKYAAQANGWTVQQVGAWEFNIIKN